MGAQRGIWDLCQGTPLGPELLAREVRTAQEQLLSVSCSLCAGQAASLLSLGVGGAVAHKDHRLLGGP